MSQATDAAVGMMDGAYFTSRNELLSFFNNLLNLNLTKIEQTASGAVACQLTEYIFPGSVQMSRVNWAAKSSHEYVDNYKLLQKAFNKHKIQRHVDVDKLIRGKYQDNLEFCQWLKAFFDQTAPMMGAGREGYDPVAVRAKGKGGKAVPTGRGGGGMAKKAPSARTAGPTAGATSSSSRPARSASSASIGGSTPRPNSSSSAVSASRVAASKENNANSSGPPAQSSSVRKVGGSEPTAASKVATKKYEEEIRSLKSDNASLKAKYSELESASAELELTLQTVESERDFYFEKLRGIEVMLQVYKEREEAMAGSGDVNRVMDSIFKVMYATMEDNVSVDDEGNLVGDITVETSVDNSAVAQDDLIGDAEEEDLLTSGLDHDEGVGVAGDAALEKEPVYPSQFSSDSDDELLTSGLDDDEPAAKISVAPVFKECAEIVHDDDDFSDEDLLTD